MTGFYPKNLKNLISDLFLRDTFDNFLLVEASFVTSYITSVDGSFQKSSQKENSSEAGAPSSAADGEPYIRWESFRPVAVDLIRGKTLPQGFRIVLMLSRKKTAAFLAAVRSDLTQEEVGGLFLNIRYQDEKLSLTTGCALKKFTLDHSLDNVWDRRVEQFLEPYLSQTKQDNC